MTEKAYELSDRSEALEIEIASLPRAQIPPSGDEPIEFVAHRLPPELAFLAADGFPPEPLLSAVVDAPKSVLALDQLLREGKLTEESYYRSLASHLGCLYYCGDIPLAHGFDPVKGLRCGVAALDPEGPGPRMVIAPRAELIPRLIKATLSGTVRSGSFAITSPQRLASIVRAYCGAEILDVALDRLPRSLAAREGMTRWQFVASSAIALFAFILAMLDLNALMALSSAIFWLIFSASVMLRSMAAVANRPTVHPVEISDDEAPNYTVVAALFHEASVVENLIRAIDSFEYPKGKLDIKLVVEQRDAETLSRIVELRLPARYDVIVAPPGEPQTKPRALNIALASARGDLVVVYDAEDVPAPDQLRLAASHFAADKDLDCLQARLTIRNHGESWLSKLFAVEYATLFDIINPGLCALNLPIPLGGTSNHFRVRSLVGVGAWDEWNVTEDADLGIRLARFGYKVRALDSDTSEEAPYELGNWFRQRVRWQKGWMQTLIVHSRQPIFFLRDLGLQRAIGATTFIVGTIFGCLFWPAFAVATFWRALSVDDSVLLPWREASDVFTYLLALSGVWVILLPALIAARLRRLKLTARLVLLLPVYYVLVSGATWAAMLDLVLRPHYWAKTAHGRSRQSSSLVIGTKTPA